MKPAYEVKDGEPIPRFMRARKSKYPFDQMEVGDYFDLTKEEIDGKAQSRATCLYTAARKHGVKVTMALVGIEGDYIPVSYAKSIKWTHMRVWRKPNGGNVPEVDTDE